MPLLNPRVDLAFKILFGTEENKDLLISFINAVVSEEDQVASIELLNPYNSRNFQNKKGSILDIKAKGVDGKYFDIEVQVSDEGDYDKRALFYWAKLYSDQLNSGDGYRKLRKAIGIHVLNFNCIVNNTSYRNKWHVTEENSGQKYFDDFSIYTIELEKFRANTDESLDDILPRIRTGLDRWSAFLIKASYLDRNHLPKEMEDPCIKKALDVLSVASLNPEEQEIYEGHLKWLRAEMSAVEKAEGKAREEGRAEGREEGRAEEREKTARILLKQGISISVIAAATGLSEQEIRSLKL